MSFNPMPFLTFPQQAIGMKIRKRIGKPCMCGHIIPGWSEMGDDNIFSGQYKQRRHRKGKRYPDTYTYGPPKNFFERPYWPSQPPSVARDAQQAKLREAVLEWQALTTEQKQSYNKIAIKKRRRGYNYFISQIINSL